MNSLAILVLVVVIALAFDFTNGFHDTGNAMATSIATGALPPRIAVALAGVLNVVGALLSFSVAATIASGLVQTSHVTLVVVFGGLAGGITWNLLTWYFGLPSSSSHAIIGGVIGATLAAAGSGAIQWHNLVAKVIVPAALSPVVAGGVAVVGTYLVYRSTRKVKQKPKTEGFRWGQVGSASLVALAHGTNDAQKTMGIITLALVVHGSIAANTKAPDWVIFSCGFAIGLGTYVGGWRVIRTLGKGLVEIESPQGMSAEFSSAATILLSSHFGYSLSTTHVASGSILGSGIGRPGAEVRWSVFGHMVSAWLLTLPMAGLVGAGAFAVARGIGGDGGVIFVFVVVVALAAGFYLASRKTKVDPKNVNAEWTGNVALQGAPPPAQEPVAA